MTTEITPLIIKSKSETQKSTFDKLLKKANIPISLTVSLPTAGLNFLDILGVPLGKYKNFSDLKNAVSKKSDLEIIEAIGSAAASETVNTFVNLVFFVDNIIKTKNVLKDLFCGKKDNKRATATGVAAIIFAISPAIAYGAIGFQEGEFELWTGLLLAGLNYLSYYTTRVSGMLNSLDFAFNPGSRFIWFLSHKLKYIEEINSNSDHTVAILPHDNQKKARTNACIQLLLDVEKDITKGNTGIAIYKINRAIQFRTIAPYVIGGSIAPLFFLGTLPTFATKTGEGLDILLEYLGISKFFSLNNFQNPEALAAVFFFTIANPMFYGRAIFLLPEEFLKITVYACQLIYYGDDKKTKLKGLGILSLIGGLAALSFFSGSGMAEVARTCIKLGRLDYLLSFISADKFINAAFLGAVGVNFFPGLKILYNVFVGSPPLPQINKTINLKQLTQIVNSTEIEECIDTARLRSQFNKANHEGKFKFSQTLKKIGHFKEEENVSKNETMKINSDDLSLKTPETTKRWWPSFKGLTCEII